MFFITNRQIIIKSHRIINCLAVKYVLNFGKSETNYFSLVYRVDAKKATKGTVRTMPIDPESP